MQRNSIVEGKDAKAAADQKIRYADSKDEEYAAELLAPTLPLKEERSEETAHYPRFTRGLFFGFLFSACLWAIIAVVFSLLT